MKMVKREKSGKGKELPYQLVNLSTCHFVILLLCHSEGVKRLRNLIAKRFLAIARNDKGNKKWKNQNER
ncbi:MAG: hypothetical protein J7L54_00865 [Elusimicrobia bacterium]|nr:hypothetical protein [Elusimicrobiota bacterium]